VRINPLGLFAVLVALDADHLGVLALGTGAEELLDLPGIGFHQVTDSRCADFNPLCHRVPPHVRIRKSIRAMITVPKRERLCRQGALKDCSGEISQWRFGKKSASV
jgi:hypothetical protein